jgi:hypothetical protein
MRPALLLVLALGALASPLSAAGKGAAPTNDVFADAVDLTMVGVAEGSIDGTNVAASKEPSEPDHAGNSGGHSVWYTWTAPGDGSVPHLAITVFGDFDTLLAVYTGSAVDMLTEVASNDDTGFFGSTGSFATTPGETYAIAVDGFAGKSGRFGMFWRESPANDNFAEAIALAGTAGSRSGDTVRGATTEHGELDRFETGATVWYSWTPPADGTYKLATAESSLDTVLAVYDGSSLETLELLVANDDDPDRGCCSSWVPLVDAQASTTYRIQVADFGGGGAGHLALQWGPLILGSSASETITGTPGAEEIRGRGGNDVILAGGGLDGIFGGPGNDLLRGGGGADLVFDHRGMDTLFGGRGNDRLDARDRRARDALAGGRGEDVCRADRGDSRRSC